MESNKHNEQQPEARVEVVSAHDLLPRDGDGSVTTFVELSFDGQRHRTAVRDHDLNPYFNERFFFAVSDPSSLPSLALDATVFHLHRPSLSRSFLGRVRIPASSVPASPSDSPVLYYPLEKRGGGRGGGVFSRIRGELGLRVFLTDDPSVQPSGQNLRQDRFADIPPEPDVSTFFRLFRSQQRQQQPSDQAPPSRVMRMFSSVSSWQPAEFQIKETSPALGGGRIVRGRVVVPGDKPGAFDLVEKMEFLFVRVVKARDLPAKDTRHFEKNQNPEWNEVFVFPRDRLQASAVAVELRDRDLVRDDEVGAVQLELNDVPLRAPPDGPLAPEWHRLEDKRGGRDVGELMLAVWFGTQADECFPYALHADTAAIDPAAANTHARGKVYQAPTMWYLRVNVVEAHDVYVPQGDWSPEVFVRGRVGNQMLRTKMGRRGAAGIFKWNEVCDFEAYSYAGMLLIISSPIKKLFHRTFLCRGRAVRRRADRVVRGPGRAGPGPGDRLREHPDRHRRQAADDRRIRPKWLDLRKPTLIDVDRLREDKFATKLQLQISLDGGYHVVDELIQYSSDFRPSSKHLWNSKKPIGVLELGILGAVGLQPMKTARDGRPTCDAFCVAKYGRKWVRTRTAVDSLSPKFNEQYAWDVYDHATVITVAVFDNSQVLTGSSTRDTAIGKVRIRLSTIETGRVYAHAYPLLVLHPSSGVKKMGELHLAVRLTATSFVSMLHAYVRPVLPKMHYTHPITQLQQENLRLQALQILAMRLGRAEPPLRREVVEYMSEAQAHLWSMRRSKAHFYRLTEVFGGAVAAAKWFRDVCRWANLVTTVLVHLLLVILVCYPQLILQTVLLHLLAVGLWNFRYRARYPPHMNTKERS
uniref:C2 domain-containing protein n=1 Tax=Ananas comosus var. bracteatus TaxID=296719 RepID=A0A6V7NJR5_ANACO|nr:unnamed protein product [Ananas comosus var. bracteatus]